MKVLHLTLKKKWFDMIGSGEKKEEYREIKEYWLDRLVWIHNSNILDDHIAYTEFLEDLQNPDRRYRSVAECLKHSDSEFAFFQEVSATNGYGHHRPSIKWKHEGIRIGKPNPLWCEPEDVGKELFILTIGELIPTS